MTRRRKLTVVGIAVALALAAGIGVVVALRQASLQERLEEVHDGMTYAEVVEIMGQPSTIRNRLPYMFRSASSWKRARNANNAIATALTTRIRCARSA